MSKLRLLYSSNAFWAASGYGVQGKSLLPRLADAPELGGRENIAQFAWYGLQGGIHHVDGFRIYPVFEEPYGNDVIGAHTRHFNANWVVTLIDAWVLKQTAQSVAPALWTPWLPIDHTPTPDAVLNAIKDAYLPLTYSKWGHEQLLQEGVKNVYIPHGVETDVFKVLDDREGVRRFKRGITGLDDAFLCVMVAANKGFPDRKWFQGQLEVFRDFAKDKPEARLYIHSLPTQHHGGINFEEFAKRLGMENKLIFPNPYLYRLGYPPEYLAMVYNAADVLLSASMSEGFGIPIVEAQACGTPAIVTNFSAMPELVNWGYTVDAADYVLTPMMSYQAWPSKRDMLDKLNRIYESWLVCGGDWPLEQRRKCSAMTHAEYDWDAIVRDQWQPLITQVAQDAPPLDRPMQAQGVDTGQDVAGFVDAVNDGLAQERKVRRVAPLPVHVGNGEAVPA